MINRVAIGQIIKNTPVELRNLARQERKVIIEASKKDPIGTAFQAAHGQFNYTNNINLSSKLNDLNVQIAKDAYKAKNDTQFIHRQPMGAMSSAQSQDVVKASHIMDVQAEIASGKVTK